ncbi:hypothetical protein ACROYT_G035300 [Oculina patagonica]
MSSIVLLVGQCGNQVGHELMGLIDKSDTHPLSHRDGKLRCVSVDSESKVISHNYREDTRSGRLYREGNMIAGQRGRGNNWALGYHGLSGETEETSLLHRAMETVRKEVERCDNYAGTIVVHSLTGGTGSGLGSRLVERIRDTYPLAHVMSVAVSPHSSGDSPLQHYNSLLSLSSLQHCADGVLLFSNDDVLHHITTHTGLLSRQKPSSSISLKDMNSYISASLAGVLQPLGSKPKLIKGKLKERGCKGGVEVINDKKDKKRFSQGGGMIRKTDTISKKLSFSLDESQDRSDVHHYKSVFGRSLGSASSLASDDHFADTSFHATDSDACTEMSRQPRSTTSALLRYRGIVNPSSSETRTSKSDSYQSSQLAAGVSSGNEPWEMLRSVCAEPSKKFATVHHITKSKVSWESLTQSLIHSIRRYDRQGMSFSTICSLLVARGDHDGSFAEVSTKIEDKLRSSLSCVEWNPFPVDFWISQYNPVGPKDSQSFTLCLNSTKIVETLEDVMVKARAMYDAGAYLHWFWKHGCSKSDFMDAFDNLDSVVEEYKLAAR